MELHFQTGALLLLIPGVVAMATRRPRLPYSVGLVAARLIISILPFAPKVSLTKDLIFTALLPPLLFEAALYIDWEQLRRDFSVVVALASPGRTCVLCGVVCPARGNARGVCAVCRFL
jgi:monovalent cation:H+ antiporter, CPA1 family